MQHCKGVRAIIISDKKKGHQTQETVDQYRRHAIGVPFPDGTLRRVLTTCRDSSMQIQMPPFGTAVVHLNLAALTAAA